jgi:hypothetical protein
MISKDAKRSSGVLGVGGGGLLEGWERGVGLPKLGDRKMSAEKRQMRDEVRRLTSGSSFVVGFLERPCCL